MRQLEELVRLGITHIVDVRLEWTDEEFVAALAPDVGYLHLGVDDAGQRIPGAWFDAVTEWSLAALTEPGAKVLLHCHMGINRGPSAGYAVLLALGFDPVDALDADPVSPRDRARGLRRGCPRLAPGPHGSDAGAAPVRARSAAALAARAPARRRCGDPSDPYPGRAFRQRRRLIASGHRSVSVGARSYLSSWTPSANATGEPPGASATTSRFASYDAARHSRPGGRNEVHRNARRERRGTRDRRRRHRAPRARGAGRAGHGEGAPRQHAPGRARPQRLDGG